MAGSYQHCRSKDGTFRFNLIENMGDAYEACEMMYWMIDFLAAADFPTGSRKMERIREAEHAYYESFNPWYDREQWDRWRKEDEEEDEEEKE